MRRRHFIAGLGGALTMPLVASAQSLIQTVGLLSASLPPPRFIPSIRQALAEAGYVEGRNLAFQYRFAEGKYDLLPGMAAELVRLQVAVIIASPTPAAIAAKAATTTVPIVFNVPDDPIKLGLVTTLSRPGGNATGSSFLLSELGAKQLGLLRELVPAANRFGLLINPANENAEAVTSDLKRAAAMQGVDVGVVRATNSHEIDDAFAALVRDKRQALVVGTDPYFYSRRVQLALLTVRHAMPAVFNAREYAEAGGLLSYGTSLIEAHRQLGIYAARILRGDKPSDLPVVQSTKFEMVINAPTARIFGIKIPSSLMASADEVME